MIDELLATLNCEAPVLFDYGIDVLSGTRVVGPEPAMKCVGQGATYRQIKGILKLTMTKQGR